MDKRISNFIDREAVKTSSTKPRTLTFDEVLLEIEKDEMYEARHQGVNDEGTNHMEFISWDEFKSYFTNYKEID